MKSLLIPGLIITIALLAGCRRDSNYHNKIYVTNNTSKSIYIDLSFDTIIGSTNHFVEHGNLKTHPNVKNTIKVNYNFDKKMKESKSDTVYLFIFDADRVESLPWDVISNHYLILKRYDLSYDDLESMDWTISYP